jgi:hypothetical protein
MTAMVLDLKKKYRLTENTILRIIDINLALARDFGGSIPAPDPDEVLEGGLPSDVEVAEALGIETTSEEESK